MEAMRSEGFAPSIVFLDIGPDPLHMAKDWHTLKPEIAYLQVEHGDIPCPSDLRCVVGLRVSVQGDDESHVEAIGNACVSAGASRVIASVTKCLDPDGRRERYETVSMTDTAGVMVWPGY